MEQTKKLFLLDAFALIYRAYFYDEPIMGDLNTDGIVNVIDIILIVNYVIENENFSNEEINIADINLDGIVNVIDIIIFITLILGE